MVSFYEWKYPKSSSIWSTMPHQIVWTKSAYLGKYLKSGIATGIKHSFFELFFISRILSHGLWHLLTKLETRCGHWLSFLCLLFYKNESSHHRRWNCFLPCFSSVQQFNLSRGKRTLKKGLLSWHSALQGPSASPWPLLGKYLKSDIATGMKHFPRNLSFTVCDTC